MHVGTNIAPRPSDGTRATADPEPLLMESHPIVTATDVPGPAQLAEQIWARLAAQLEGACIRQLARDTRYNHETIRRYLIGRSRLPAAFVAAVCAARHLEPLWVLYGVGSPWAEGHHPGGTTPTRRGGRSKRGRNGARLTPESGPRPHMAR